MWAGSSKRDENYISSSGVGLGEIDVDEYASFGFDVGNKLLTESVTK